MDNDMDWRIRTEVNTEQPSDIATTNAAPNVATTVDDVAGKTFDYVVIGGGTAGLVLATRLTEDPSLNVLVLEGGPANLDDPAILTPAAFGSHFKNPKYDWDYTTVPQPHVKNRVVTWPRGKGLGGSSAINYFQYHLPSKGDVDAIERLGNKGWNFDLLKRYHLKSERFVEPKVKHLAMSYDLAQHGTDGPIAVGYPLTQSGFEQPYHDTLANLGIQRAKEPFSGDHRGTWLCPISVDPITRTRSYAANKYYAPNSSRKNFTVLTCATATKLQSTKNADGTLTITGVEFLHEGKKYTTLVGKEAILSTGSVTNPQILELSGIGDKEVLEKAGVEVKLELPAVGNNLQEHVYTANTFEVCEAKQDEVTTFDCMLDPSELGKQAQLFATEGKGVFGMSLYMISFVPLTDITSEAGKIYAELEKTINERIEAGKYSPSLVKQYKLQLERIKEGVSDVEFVLSQTAIPVPGLAKPGKKYASMSTLFNLPFSRGSIHIKSSDPRVPPTIDPHYFEEEHDMRVFTEIFKFTRRIAQTEPLKSYLMDGERFPGPQVETDEQIADYLKTSFSTSYHPVGVCSMLPREDGGVVDTKLKVYGTTNLRVADVSIIPLQFGAHLQATAYAIGEIAADIIKGKLDL
ncbi:alcohol oxidase [Agrocybe pediades]|nr:alcohol oxidase [Agrocybe pediades]